jgi:hypothetical protein
MFPLKHIGTFAFCIKKLIRLKNSFGMPNFFMALNKKTLN